jgi:hypothetical protein
MAENRQRGLVRIATDIQQGHVDPGAVSSNLPSTGIERTMSEVAGEFGRIGDRIGRMADHAAAVEGEQAGKIAGLDPEFRPTGQLTIRGEAYDRAGLQIWTSNARVAISGELEAAWDKHQDNPSALSKAIGEVRGNWLRNVPEQVRPEFEVLFRKQHLTYMRKAARQQAARVAAEHKAATESEVADRLRAVQQRAASLGLDGEADAILADDMRGLAGVLARRGPDGKPVYSPTDQLRTLRRAEEDVTTSRLLGAFARLPSAEAKSAFIAELEADWRRSEGLAKVYDLDGIRRVTGILEGELRQAQAADRLITQQAKAQVKSVTDRLARGYTIPPDEMIATRTIAAGVGDPAIADELARAEDLMHFGQAVRRFRPGELEARVRAERERLSRDGARPHDAARLELAERISGEMSKALASDPIEWAQRAGMIPPVPLDFSDPARFAESLQVRAAHAGTVADIYGIQPKYLSGDEGRRLGAMLAQAGDGAFGPIAAVQAVLGERAPAFFAEVSKDAPAIAVVGAHVTAHDGAVSRTARDAINGMGLMRTPGYKERSTIKDVESATQEVLGQVLGHVQDAIPGIRTAARAAYEYRANIEQVTGFDAGLYKQVLREIVGERRVGNRVFGGIAGQQRGYLWGTRGAPVIVPPWIEQHRFGEVIDAIRPEDLVDGAGKGPSDDRGRPLPMASVRQARAVTIGMGRYWLAMSEDPADPQYIQRDGRPLVLDLEALRPALERRVPHLLVGSAARASAVPDSIGGISP